MSVGFFYRKDSDCDDSLGTFTAISERGDIKLFEWPTKPRFHVLEPRSFRVAAIFEYGVYTYVYVVALRLKISNHGTNFISDSYGNLEQKKIKTKLV